MAHFKTHITVGTISSTLITVFCWRYKLFTSVSVAAISAVLGIVGSILPDIDAKKSIPTRIIINILSLVSVGIVFVGLRRFNTDLEFGLQIGISISSYIGVRFLLPIVLSSITYHRGLIHSVPMAILLTLLLIMYFAKMGYTRDVSFLIGAFFCGGFLIHLILDEVYSVDLMGVKLKSSFGTAFQIFSFAQPIRYLILYCLIGYIYFTYLTKLPMH